MDVKGIFATIVGIIALFFFGSFAYYLAKHAGDVQQQQWDRLVYIFGGVEAVAFAAAGFFFGREVNRERAENAEDKAKEAEKTAKEDGEKKSKAETKLNSLVKYIETQAPHRSIHAVVMDDLRNQARQTGIEEQAPELMASIEAKYSAAGSVPDERWDALERFAKGL